MSSANKDAGNVEVASPSDPEVMNKYKAAADIANRALTFAIAGAVVGANILELCQKTDEEIAKMADGVYKTDKIVKGISFPTSISVNNVLCHFSPISSDAEASCVLKEGDLAKIELGAQIDGFPALVCHSLVVGATTAKPATGLAAELILAAQEAAEAAMRLVRPGNNSVDICPPLVNLAGEYGFKFIEGMISYSVGKDTLAGETSIIINPSEAQRTSVRRSAFAENEVFVIDLAISSDEGRFKPHPSARVSIYARNSEAAVYKLKLKTSRAIYSEIQHKFGAMAFNVRGFENTSRARVALTECSTHGLVLPYEVLCERNDAALTARFMYTVILTPNGPMRITDYKFNAGLIKAESKVKSPELVELLKKPVGDVKAK